MPEDISCPICGSEMVVRTAKKGPNADQAFYVCIRHPECKGKVSIREEDDVDGFLLEQEGNKTVSAKCAEHPERAAVTTCTNCGKGICYYCKTTIGGNAYCPSCANEIQKGEKKVKVEAISSTGQRKVKEGQLGYFDLSDWWFSTFSDEETEYIEQIYQPMGLTKSKILTQGKIGYSSGTAAGLLIDLAGWFKKPQDYSIACRILNKAETLSDINILNQHFLYQQMIQIHYRMREIDSVAFDNAVAACKKQITIAPEAIKAFLQAYLVHRLPAHVGYTQLAIILEKKQRYDEAIQLCKQAQQQGWNGDWDKRIERCQVKMSKKAND